VNNQSNGLSVLVSVYSRDNALFLKQALTSIFEQTLRPTEVVLVKDGPVTVELEDVIGSFVKQYDYLKIIPLEKNKGLGAALNIGLQYCSNEIVARMDSDDISKPDRFDKEYRFLKENPDIALVGSWIEEFINDAGNTVGFRKVPECTKEITTYAKLRCPFNHPTVMFRKSAIMAVGSYIPFGTFEDYHLWSRVLMAGYKVYNFQESHLYFRTSSDMYKRRGGLNKTRQEYELQRYFYKSGFVNLPTFIRNLIIRGLFRAAPSKLRGIFYNKR